MSASGLPHYDLWIDREGDVHWLRCRIMIGEWEFQCGTVIRAITGVGGAASNLLRAATQHAVDVGQLKVNAIPAP